MVIPNLKFSEMGGYSGVNFGHPKSEVFRNGGGGLSGLQFQKGAIWKIWTKIYCSARNLLVHHSSLSHTTYVETNNGDFGYFDQKMDSHYAAVGGRALPQESVIAHSCIYIKYIQLKLPNFKNNNDAYIITQI